MQRSWTIGRVLEPNEETENVMSVHNLKILAIGFKMYADYHGGRFPDKFSALYPEYVTELKMLICPELQRVYKKERGEQPVAYNCDIDNDGDVDAIDVQLVINAVLGIDISSSGYE